jgi:mycothiol system anti-sigma-R factor
MSSLPQHPEHADHEPADCADVLASLYLFLDSEIDVASSAEIRRHLDACAPCLSEYDLEKVVKALVARSCRERAPEPLRDRVLLSIRQVHVQITELTVTDVPTGEGDSRWR